MLTKFHNVGIEAIATCLPRQNYSLWEYAPDLVNEKLAKRYAKSTGFERLHITSTDVTTADLCLCAAKCLFGGGRSVSEIDAIVFVTQTPTWTLPATSHWLQNELGLRNDVLCFDINEGCSGYEQGLYLASLLVSSKQCQKVLLLVGDTISKITSSQDKATRLIFGDAGTASIVSPMECDMVFNIKSYGERSGAIVREHNGFLQMDGGGIMQFTLNDVPRNIDELLQYSECSKDAVDLYACHQANKLILNSLADIMQVPSEKLPFIASQIGNTSSASIPLVLTQYRDKDLKKVMLCGFGVGLACSLCLTDLSKTDIKERIYYE